MERYTIRSICVASLLAIAFAIVTHESSHVLGGWLAGGTPTLITATEMKGEWSALSPIGFAVLGASGSLANLILCVLGWWVLSREPETAELRLTAWFFYAVNGMLLTTKMLVEAISGFGDWMSILRPFDGSMLSRVVVAVLGVVGVIFMVRSAGPALARLIPPGGQSERMREALRIILVGAAASSVLVVCSSVVSPLGTTRGVLLALGASLCPLIPMLSGLRFIRKVPSTITSPIASGGWPWLVATGVTVIVMVFVYGPGIRLSGILP